MANQAHFGPEFFGFLDELRDNNNRDWFQANKERYESDVRDPLLAFVAEFAGPLRKISPHMVADPRPTGGSIFRIYRDVRFSKDKSPYKTAAAAHFRHEVGKEVHGPGYYLHLEPGSVFVGAGMWHPESATLGKVRDAMVAHPKRWKQAAHDPGFKLDGDSLKRPPKGYDADHPLIEDLKRKDFTVSQSFSQGDAQNDGFIDQYSDFCRRSAPLMEFLTTAVGLPW